MVDRRLNVLQNAGRRQRLGRGLQAHALAHVVLGVAQVHASLNAVKGGRRNRQVTGRGVAVRHRLDVRIDAENFLQHHHRALGLAGRHSQVGRQLETISGGQFNERGHGELLLKTKGKNQLAASLRSTKSSRSWPQNISPSTT